MGKADHWPMSDVMGAMNLGTIAQTAHIVVIMWQRCKEMLKEMPKGMLKVMPKQAKAKANTVITEKEGEDVEGSPERMDEDVEAEKIRQLEQRMALFEQGAGASVSAPPQMHQGGHDSDSDSSSGSDSSGSDSE